MSIFNTSPTLQVNPFVIELLIALSGGHWFPIDDTFKTGSISALAYGTDKSNIKFKVEPQRSYSCVCRIAGVIANTKSILTTFSSRRIGITFTKVTFILTLTAEQRCDSLSFKTLSYCATRSLYCGKQALETAPRARYCTVDTT